MSEVVITGVGLLSAAGPSAESCWSNLSAGVDATRALSASAGAFGGALRGGEITGFDAKDFMPARLAQKLDVFCQFAVASAIMAVRDSGLKLTEVDREGVGVYVGNTFGGWRFTDRELRHLHQEGVRKVSPFQATAWFPTAPQGQITILLGLHGHSKTIDCGRASGLASIAYAARAIQSGRCDIVIAGGSEAVANPFVLSACASEGAQEHGHRISPRGRYEPFGRQRDGWVVGEGGAFVVLERKEHAQARGARIYGSVGGFGLRHEAVHPDYSRSSGSLAAAMRTAIAERGLSPAEVDLVMADGAGTAGGDASEAAAICEVLGDGARVTVPKTMFGQTYGAAGAIDVVLSALSLRHQYILPTVELEEDVECRIRLQRGRAASAPLRNVVVNARGTGGVCASMLLCA